MMDWIYASSTRPRFAKFGGHQAENLNALGLAYTNIGKRTEAASAYESALKIQSEFVDADSANREYRVDLGLTKNNFGLLLKSPGNL